MRAIDPNFRLTGRNLNLVLAAWLAMLGFDFFLHGGLLAGLYAEPSPFLLDPDKAFELIPVGYASFLIYALLLVWLAVRTGIRNRREGTVFGLRMGVLVWGSLSLGLLSISTAEPKLILAWFCGQALESSIAGFVIGLGLKMERHRRLYAYVLLFGVVMILITIALQNLGLAPAGRIIEVLHWPPFRMAA